MKITLLTIICLSTSLFAQTKVKVLLNPKKDQMVGALCVIFEANQSVSKENEYFKYKLINRTKQNIFVVIDNGENRDHVSQIISQKEIGSASAGGSSLGLASTHQTLRLLYSPRLEEGKITSGKDEMSSQTNCISRVNFGSNISKLNDSRGLLFLTVSFYATNAKGFQIETIKVPVSVSYNKAKQQNKTQ